MSMVFAERKSLADALRRYLNTTEDYDVTEKAILRGILDKFERWGINLINDQTSRERFFKLIERASTV